MAENPSPKNPGQTVTTLLGPDGETLTSIATKLDTLDGKLDDIITALGLVATDAKIDDVITALGDANTTLSTIATNTTP